MAAEEGESPSAPSNLRHTNEMIEQFCPLVEKRVCLRDMGDTARPELNGALGTATGFGFTTYVTPGAPQISIDTASGMYTVKLDAPRGSDGGVTGLPALVVKVHERYVQAYRGYVIPRASFF